jgi:hypothetical protein
MKKGMSKTNNGVTKDKIIKIRPTLYLKSPFFIAMMNLRIIKTP